MDYRINRCLAGVLGSLMLLLVGSCGDATKQTTTQESQVPESLVSAADSAIETSAETHQEIEVLHDEVDALLEELED